MMNKNRGAITAITKTGGKMTCDNCGAKCPILETRGAILNNLLYYLGCRKCGCFYTSEDKIHWDLAWQIKPELIKKGGQE